MRYHDRNRVIEEYLGREAEVPADISFQPVIGTMNLGGSSRLPR